MQKSSLQNHFCVSVSPQSLNAVQTLVANDVSRDIFAAFLGLVVHLSKPSVCETWMSSALWVLVR